MTTPIAELTTAIKTSRAALLRSSASVNCSSFSRSTLCSKVQAEMQEGAKHD